MAENPRTVYVSGMPLMYRGYNGLYEWDHMRDTYHRREHQTYYGLPIKETLLVRMDDEWQLHHRSGRLYEPTQFHQLRPYESPGPLGEWNAGVLVTREPSLKTWFQSNKGLLSALVLVICFIYLYKRCGSFQ